MSLPLQEFVLRITRRRIFFKDKFPYPGYQRFFLPCDEELRRLQADTSSAFGGKTRAAKPETAHEKPLAPRVKFPLQEFFWGELSPGNAIGLTAQYLPWRGEEMSSFEIIPTHAFNFFVKYAIFESGNSFIMTIIFPWSKILSVRNFTLSRFCFKLFRRAMRNNH